ncbi:Uncharacterised protein [Mycolicibacterium vanbaalenii]|uniref:EthD domain-containing protein n=1 Tax=Mycolicibacterium vanbaalenii TaxID=110539 RepID=A0A5S9R987_MYCVN|nr:DUF4286 family protein [Mycolicibacterium vanbaalenii]CAA0136676.1 Uncharacterised protein [Mycolicibacterium vanbaalenii]
MQERELFVVLTNAIDGREVEFNRWYDEVHVPAVLNIAGVLSAQRYSLRKLGRPELAPNPGSHRYLTIYEVDRDGNLVCADLIAQSLSGAMDLSESFDLTTASMDSWQPIGSEHRRT